MSPGRSGRKLGPGDPGDPGYRPESGFPARPYQPGNPAAMDHGATVPRVVDPLAREYVEKIASLVPYLTADPSYSAAVWAWARAEARVQLIAEWIDANGGPLDEDGIPRPALTSLQTAEATAAKSRERLGLDPMARAMLGADLVRGEAMVDLIDDARRIREDAGPARAVHQARCSLGPKRLSHL